MVDEDVFERRRKAPMGKVCEVDYCGEWATVRVTIEENRRFLAHWCDAHLRDAEWLSVNEMRGLMNHATVTRLEMGAAQRVEIMRKTMATNPENYA